MRVRTSISRLMIAVLIIAFAMTVWRSPDAVAANLGNRLLKALISASRDCTRTASSLIPEPSMIRSKRQVVSKEKALGALGSERLSGKPAEWASERRPGRQPRGPSTRHPAALIPPSPSPKAEHCPALGRGRVGAEKGSCVGRFTPGLTPRATSGRPLRGLRRRSRIASELSRAALLHIRAGYSPIVRTTRNRALPLIMRS
jgi:hypothetical protein